MPQLPKPAKTGRRDTPRRPGVDRPTPPLAAPEPRPTVIPLQRQTVTSLAVAMLRDRILHGAYPEGEPLRQDALAKELGVSRIPVREALRQLEAEGLVTFNPHRGAIVSSLSLAEIEETFSLRAEIEGDLLRRALPRLGDEQLRRAAEILDGYQRALRTGDITAWGEFNWQFHSLLYAPAERPVTMGIVQRLHQQSDRYLRMQLALTHGESRANEEHRAILAAVRRHDGKRAVALMKQHILGAGRSLLDFLETQRAASGAARDAEGRAPRATRVRS
jgi:DNA-binding GntR family transcriptional regulator